jgi:hypothetical protein
MNFFNGLMATRIGRWRPNKQNAARDKRATFQRKDFGHEPNAKDSTVAPPNNATPTPPRPSALHRRRDSPTDRLPHAVGELALEMDRRHG